MSRRWISIFAAPDARSAAATGELLDETAEVPRRRVVDKYVSPLELRPLSHWREILTTAVVTTLIIFLVATFIFSGSCAASL